MEDREALIAVLQKRLRDQRREELAWEIEAARKELEAGKCRPTTPAELLKEILG